MTYQIISFKNEQFLVKPGSRITVNGLGDLEIGQTVTAQVLLNRADANLEIGTPHLEPSVTLTVESHPKSPKIRVSTYKAKSRLRKTIGHRQGQTVLSLQSLPVKAKPTAKTKTKSIKK